MLSRVQQFLGADLKESKYKFKKILLADAPPTEGGDQAIAQYCRTVMLTTGTDPALGLVFSNS